MVNTGVDFLGNSDIRYDRTRRKSSVVNLKDDDNVTEFDRLFHVCAATTEKVWWSLKVDRRGFSGTIVRKGGDLL